MKRTIGLIVFLAVILMSGLPFVAANTPPDAPGKRYALVIGNSDYANTEVLRNPVNDAHAVADQLRGLNVNVIELIDATQQQMRSALDLLSAQAKGSDAVLFYYSGHGFQLNSKNFLVPVDATLRNRNLIETENVGLDDIIATLQGADHETVILLDACRSNPLPASMQSESGKGLAEVQEMQNVYVAFATAPGDKAFDGGGDNSPFTTAFLKNIAEPGLSISDLMIRVRVDVEDATNKAQATWDQSTLRRQFYFLPEVERDASLTDQDLELLTNLPPNLRAQFEEAFNIKITPPEPQFVEVAMREPVATPEAPVVSTEIIAPTNLGSIEGKAVVVQPQGSVTVVAIDPIPETPVSDEVPDVPTQVALVEPVVPLPRVRPSTGVVVTPVTPEPAEVPEVQEAIAAPQVPVAEPVVTEPSGEATVTAYVQPEPVVEPTPAQEAITEDVQVAEAASDTPVDLPSDLPRAVQAELVRLGCYRSAVDGDWGPLSRRGLLRYYASRQLAPDGNSPSPEVYRRLVSEPFVVCVQTKRTDTTTQVATVIDVEPPATTRPTRTKRRLETTPGHTVTPSGNVVPDQKAPIRITPGISMF